MRGITHVEYIYVAVAHSVERHTHEDRIPWKGGREGNRGYKAVITIYGHMKTAFSAVAIYILKLPNFSHFRTEKWGITAKLVIHVPYRESKPSLRGRNDRPSPLGATWEGVESRL